MRRKGSRFGKLEGGVVVRHPRWANRNRDEGDRKLTQRRGKGVGGSGAEGGRLMGKEPKMANHRD